MIWKDYVFRRGIEVEELWDQMYEQRAGEARPVNLLYVAGKGFDPRANRVIATYVERLLASDAEISGKLLLIEFPDHRLSSDLQDITTSNEAAIREIFNQIGPTTSIVIGADSEGEDDINTTTALRQAAATVIGHIDRQTDIVIDVTSLPRLAYVTIILSALAKLVHSEEGDISLVGNGITLQVLVGEDPDLDGRIKSEDPSNDMVLVPGYSEALQSEALGDVPVVWFPLLGENRLGQIMKVEQSIPDEAEICPILPHPSRNPRRGDQLLVEYSGILFGRREMPISNILYAHEAHPFEAYRQLLEAMQRYRETLAVMGGCRLVVTPLASKLGTVGAALACFEMKLRFSAEKTSSVAISYADNKRYIAEIDDLIASKPVVSALVLTGDPYVD